jgi:YedE family putative selenium metabolism protein
MIVPMLRGEQSNGTRMRAVVLMLGLGALAAVLVLAGNPGNMGLCGACFLRDLAGALRLHQGPAIVRPEVPGLVLGALLWSLLARRHIGRSGSHAVARLLLCAAMAIGAMVFLGCPFRMLQRLGGGDLNAWLALPGFVVGVGVARWFEQRGYSLGKTQEVPRPIGLLGPLVLFVPLLAWLAGTGLAGPAFGADGAVGPARAPWLLALGIALLGGGVLSATGFCAISAARSLFGGQRWMLWAALAFVLGYALAALAGGRWHASFDGQPIAHGDWLWNTLALLLVGLCGAFAGGCPVRQLVMAGEGNGDALVGCVGLVLGAALAHNLGIAAAAAGPSGAGGPGAAAPAAILVLLLAVLGYAAAMTRRSVVAS